MSFTAKIKLVLSKIWDFLEPFIKIFLSSTGQILAGVALQVVADIAKDTSIVSDEDKRKAAFDKIVVDLKRKGIELGLQVTTSMINSAIEVAVQKLKDNPEE